MSKENLYGIIQLEVSTRAAWRELCKHFFENLSPEVSVKLTAFHSIKINLDEIEDLSEEDMNGRNYTHWTDEEVEKLKREYSTKPVEDLCVEMSRTNQSIRQKALSLGLKKEISK